MIETENKKVWLVSADMGFGHQRAVYPLKSIADGKIINVGVDSSTSKGEQKLWKRVLRAYELISRAKGLPIIGNFIFGLLDSLLHIPSLYPLRDLSYKTLQVDLLEHNIKRGLCSGMLETIRTKDQPMITSFYAPAVAANMRGISDVYCIICDADLNRVWVAKDPWESKITYFAPCSKVEQRLRAYGVPNEKVLLTGFPLPLELIGNRELDVLKYDLAQRLKRLDPKGEFCSRHGINVRHFLGEENCAIEVDKKITLTYSIGGAGAQKEIGAALAKSLKTLILENKIKLNLVAGTRENIKNYFVKVASEISNDPKQIEVFCENNIEDYFNTFNRLMHSTDILWTKPSELSFYSALGLPIIMSPAIGSQEKFNRKWLLEIRAGIRQIKPDYAHQWLIELLDKGLLADAAWSGFLRARKLGTYNIIDIINTGKFVQNQIPIMR
ncbi:MAG: hypothetical protein M0P71_02005 [Melioribacteraceae bacterium]|nr:hypothetical protein [Melioribacteraceae bacterium]